MRKQQPGSLKLEIEDLEERIAPGAVLTVGLLSPEGAHTVNGPEAAVGGAVTAFTNVAINTTIANIDLSLVC